MSAFTLSTGFLLLLIRNTTIVYIADQVSRPFIALYNFSKTPASYTNKANAISVDCIIYSLDTSDYA